MKSVTGLLATGAAFAAAISLIAAAQAEAQAPVAHPSPSATLRRQLHDARAKLAQEKARLADKARALTASQAQVTALQAQVSQQAAAITVWQDAVRTRNQQIGSLNSTIATLTASRDTYLHMAQSLQTKLNAEPDSLAFAEAQVQREVGWAENQGSSASYGQLVSLSAMDYVVGHVSTGAYGYRDSFGLPLPDSSAQSVLFLQAGICGHAALTFARIVGDLGLQVRSVQFYYSNPDGTPNAHIAVEVSYDGGWHFFDPTFGVYWSGASGTTLSVTDVRAGGGTEHKDAVSFTNVIEDPWFAGDDTAFETDPATTVVLDGQPL